MSENEDAQSTLVRLLKHNLRVVKDDGSLATVNVTGEWQDADALKGYDGQVTVGLAECVDQKLELSGTTRKRTSIMRVNVWTTEAPNAENGRVMRNKIVEELNRVVRQNRTKPNQTLYNLVGLGSGGKGSKAYQSNSELAPNNGLWTELSSVEYQQLWYSDDNRYQVSYGEDGEYAAVLVGFKLESRKNTVQKLVFAVESYAITPNGDSVTVKVWNNAQAEWQHERTQGGNEQDHTVTTTIADSASDCVDDEGYVWLLARTTDPSDGSTPATLFCDYASCTATVNGITYCDIAGYRPLDRVDVKPFIFRTEFTVKSWFFENTGVLEK
jgi:hypothetical protein